MNNPVLVIGAGPVGLSAALFCHRGGQNVRIFEKLKDPVQESKALAINPRTLELLEPTGVTSEMLKLGLKVNGASLWRENSKPIGGLDLSVLPTRYPFMLALSQSVTERLLTEALAARGVHVERERTVETVENSGEGAKIKLNSGEVIEGNYVFAADGSHSAVRKSCGIDFVGTSFATQWHLADVALKTNLAPDRAHVFFNDGPGFYFLLRVVQNINTPSSGDPIWRVFSSLPNPLENFRYGTPTQPPIWTSSFHISHKINSRLRSGSIFFGGDAAHIHSPVGARGMNLGIEDAWVFAQLLKDDELELYDERRHTVDKGVVHRVDLISRIATGDHAYLRAFRKFVLPHALKLSPLKSAFARAMTGLDHNLY